MRGGDTTGLRAYNERLVMSVLLRAGALSRAEIARETGLSGQAASVIVSRLAADGMVVKRPKVRGQVGQPSTPIAPNPDGAYSVGVKIGRRSIEVILVNLLGEVVASSRVRYPAPIPQATVTTAVEQVRALLEPLTTEARERVVGIGIAMPGEIQAWSAELDLAPGALDGWSELDVTAVLRKATGLATTLFNDATAACAAEMIAGHAVTRSSALYIYLGTFIGGGVVLDGRLYQGERFNAGAIGSMPTGQRAADGCPEQLIHKASVIQLVRQFEARGLETEAALSGELADEADHLFEAWVEQAAPALAGAVVSALAVVDFETVIIDGLLPPAWRERITCRVTEELAGFNRAGLSPADIVSGSIGRMARVLGAAMLPLEARFSPNTDLLVRQPPSRTPVAGKARQPAEA